MYEVEVKVPAELDHVRDRLDELDAEALGAVVQSDTYYDAPHRSFPETDEALRIREERRAVDLDEPRIDDLAERQTDDLAERQTDDLDERRVIAPGKDDAGDASARVTYKGPLIDDESKTREEVETSVESAAELDAILRNLGFEPAATVRKERERFALDGYTVTLDAVDGVGEYVEVELEAAEDGIDSAREGAFDVLKRLGLDQDRQVQTSYLGLLLADEE